MDIQLVQTKTGELIGVKNIKDLLVEIDKLPAERQSELLTKTTELRSALEKIEKQIKSKAGQEATMFDDNLGEWFGHKVQVISKMMFDEKKMLESEDPKFVEKYKETKDKYLRFTIYKKVI